MAINVNSSDRLVALLDQPGRLQVIQFVTHGALGKTGVLSQRGSRRERASTIRSGIVGQAQQNVPGTGILENLRGQRQRP